MRDRIGRVSATARRGVRTVVSPTGLRGTALELAWIATHGALYPLGMLRERAEEAQRLSLEGLPPVQRGLLIGNVEAAGTPILLVHGMVDNRSIFTLLRRALRRRGFGRVRTMNYSVLTHDVRSAARKLAVQVEQLCEETGYERIHVIGHSLGGVIARYYTQCLGGDARVHTLATLGSPHAGTVAARLLPVPLTRQLRPGSTLIAELAAPVTECRTRFIAFYSDLDQLIVPQRAARIDHPQLAARNILLRGVAHMSLPIDRRVIHELTRTLAHLDPDGSTVTAGVTSIASSPPAPPRAGGTDRPGSSAATTA